jgi:hypothetical protein
MDALKQVALHIHHHSDTEDAAVLNDLCRALETGESFDLSRLYRMTHRDFEMAMSLLREWRLDQWIPNRTVGRFLAEIREKSKTRV